LHPPREQRLSSGGETTGEMYCNTHKAEDNLITTTTILRYQNWKYYTGN